MSSCGGGCNRSGGPCAHGDYSRGGGLCVSGESVVVQVAMVDNMGVAVTVVAMGVVEFVLVVGVVTDAVAWIENK